MGALGALFRLNFKHRGTQDVNKQGQVNEE